MEEKQKTRTALSVTEWVYRCVGIILVCLCIIGATNQTFLGRFITYGTAYIFGFFYPFVLAFLLLLGLQMIIKMKGFPVRGHAFLWTGLVLVLVSCLGFGSFSFIAKNPDLALTDVMNVYSDRMLGFARYPFHVDNYAGLGGLGGGFIGLFAVGLFGSVFHAVGDAILFALLLLLGVFFIIYRPVMAVVRDQRGRRERKVAYSSPYQNNAPIGEAPGTQHYQPKGVFGKIFHRSPKPEIATQSRSSSEDVYGQNGTAGDPKPFLFARGNVEETTASDTLPTGTIPAPIRNGNSGSPANSQGYGSQGGFVDYSQGGFARAPQQPSPQPAPTPTIRPEPANPYQNTSAYGSSQGGFTNTQGGFTGSQGGFVPQEPARNPENTLRQQPTSFRETPAPAPSYPTSDQGGFGSFSRGQTIPSEKDQLASQRAQDFYNVATGPNHNDLDVSDAPLPPSFNPLASQAQALNNAPKAPQTVVGNEFRVESAGATQDVLTPEPQSMPEEPSITPEAMEAQREAKAAEEYFRNKAQRQIQQRQAAEMAKKKRLADVMQYVSDKPRRYNYRFPDDSLLSEIDDSSKQQVNMQAAQEKAAVINQVFKNFNFPAKAVSFTVGASITRFNIETEPGVKADKIEGYLGEFQRALNGDQSVRIQTVVEGRSTSGIEAKNAAPMAVSFKSIFREIERNTKDNLLLPIGQDVGGNMITYPLDRMPHLLVAGTTGSGKSVLVNCMIMTLIMRNYPSQLKLMLIDPKQVEFAKYEMEPHLYCPVIQDSESAINALGKLCTEMDRRYSLLKSHGCVKISEYREKRVGNESMMEEIPDVVCVIDEFADLMNTGGDEIAGYVQRLTQKSRAAGIYLIIATQRPSKDAIPMIIKGNIVCRIGLSCSSQIDSRVILDENGCEALIGRGDLLFKEPGKKNLVRAQSAFISDADQDAILSYLKANAGTPNYDADFIDLKPQQEDAVSGDLTPEDIYEEIRDFVMETGISTRSAIMQNFSLTLSKADQILMHLRQEGIIMPGAGGKYIVLKRKEMEN